VCGEDRVVVRLGLLALRADGGHGGVDGEYGSAAPYCPVSDGEAVASDGEHSGGGARRRIHITASDSDGKLQMMATALHQTRRTPFLLRPRPAGPRPHAKPTRGATATRTILYSAT
jgi:hypothetical protein